MEADFLPPCVYTPDPAREKVGVLDWDPSRQLIRSVRLYQQYRFRQDAIGKLIRKACTLNHRFWSVITGADIPANTKIGVGVQIPHPNGVVIHPNSKVGTNCLIMQQVTIGIGTNDDVPVIGGGCEIGAGAKILGGVIIGDGAIIGANAVVVSDVPAGYVAMGIPARSKPSRRMVEND